MFGNRRGILSAMDLYFFKKDFRGRGFITFHVSCLASIEESKMIPSNPHLATWEKSVEKKTKNKQVLVISIWNSIHTHPLYTMSSKRHENSVSSCCLIGKTIFQSVIWIVVNISIAYGNHVSKINVKVLKLNKCYFP